MKVEQLPGDNLSGLHHDTISSVEGALASGILNRLDCLPDSTGVYHTYKESLEPVLLYADSIIPDSERTGIQSEYQRRDCPTFNKCQQCPELIGEVAVNLDLPT